MESINQSLTPQSSSKFGAIDLLFNSISRKLQRGFNLIEVTLSLGIISIGFMTLIAMLPLGLKTFRHSMMSTLQAQITQTIMNDAQQTPFQQLETDLTGDYFFDEEGVNVAEADARFHVVVNVANNYTTMPGGGASTVSASHLKTVTMTMKHIQSSDAAREMSFYVPDIGF